MMGDENRLSFGSSYGGLTSWDSIIVPEISPIIEMTARVSMARKLHFFQRREWLCATATTENLQACRMIKKI